MEMRLPPDLDVADDTASPGTRFHLDVAARSGSFIEALG
jgi:hypothetical protein